VAATPPPLPIFLCLLLYLNMASHKSCTVINWMSERTLATATHVRAWPPTALNAKRIHYIMIKNKIANQNKKTSKMTRIIY
jgi:hypothetical protein